MSEQTITIRVDNCTPEGRPYDIAVDVYGVWAVHMIVTVNFTQTPDHWTVTHAPTGLSINVDCSESIARSIAHRLSQVCGARTKSGVMNVKAKIKAIRDEEASRGR